MKLKQSKVQTARAYRRATRSWARITVSETVTRPVRAGLVYVPRDVRGRGEEFVSVPEAVTMGAFFIRESPDGEGYIADWPRRYFGPLPPLTAREYIGRDSMPRQLGAHCFGE